MFWFNFLLGSLLLGVLCFCWLVIDGGLNSIPQFGVVRVLVWHSWLRAEVALLEVHGTEVFLFFDFSGCALCLWRTLDLASAYNKIFRLKLDFRLRDWFQITIRNFKKVGNCFNMSLGRKCAVHSWNYCNLCVLLDSALKQFRCCFWCAVNDRQVVAFLSIWAHDEHQTCSREVRDCRYNLRKEELVGKKWTCEHCLFAAKALKFNVEACHVNFNRIKVVHLNFVNFGWAIGLSLQFFYGVLVYGNFGSTSKCSDELEPEGIANQNKVMAELDVFTQGHHAPVFKLRTPRVWLASESAKQLSVLRYQVATTWISVRKLTQDQSCRSVQDESVRML